MEKIDIVITFVDSSDVKWQELYNQYVPQVDNVQINGKQRFRKNSHFIYLFRGIEKYAPWINNVFLVVQSMSQVPKWINTSTVKIILHEDFIPHEYLPVFNSQAIEMFLHKIPNLSEKFLYANDDNYFVGNISESDFFEDDKVKTSFSRCKYVQDSENDMPLWKVSIINSGMLANKLETESLKKESIYLAPMHGIRPYLKSKIEEFYNKYSNEILSSISRFRERKNLTVYLYDFYLRQLGLTKEKNYMFSYFSSSSPIGLIGMSIINPHQYKTICINDTSESEDEKRSDTINQYFKSQFPKLSKYESIN